MTAVTYQAAVCGQQGNYGVVFPDFPGGTSGGATIDKALAKAVEGLSGHIAISAEYGDVIPEPKRYALDDVQAAFADASDPRDPEWVQMIDVTVDVPIAEVTVPLLVPQSLARDIDQVTSDRRQFIVDATRRELERLKQADRKDAA